MENEARCCPVPLPVAIFHSLALGELTLGWLKREASFVCCGNALASAIAKQQEQLRRRRGCFVMSLQAGSNGHREARAPPAPREGEPQTASNPDGRFSFSPRGFWRRLQRVKKKKTRSPSDFMELGSSVVPPRHPPPPPLHARPAFAKHISEGAASRQSDCRCKLMGYKRRWRQFLLFCLVCLLFLFSDISRLQTIDGSLDPLNRWSLKLQNTFPLQQRKVDRKLQRFPHSYLKTQIVYLHLEHRLQERKRR